MDIFADLCLDPCLIIYVNEMYVVIWFVLCVNRQLCPLQTHHLIDLIRELLPCEQAEQE